MAQEKKPQEETRTTDTLRSIYPSGEMMRFVEAIIAREQKNPKHEQTAEHPISDGPHYLSSLFPSKEMEEYVRGIMRELE